MQLNHSTKPLHQSPVIWPKQEYAIIPRHACFGFIVPSRTLFLTLPFNSFLLTRLAYAYKYSSLPPYLILMHL